jgi:putative hydrolase
VRAPRKPSFCRFSELSWDAINIDFQVHTNWTDGQCTVAQILDRAMELELSALTFTEHARYTSDYYPDFFAEVDECAAERPEITVYRGFEIKILDRSGKLDISPEMRACADLVIASVHSLPTSDGGRAMAREFARDEAARLEFELARGMLERQTADVLSHAGGMSLRTFGAFPDDYMEELVSLAARTGVVFEINSSYHSDSLETLLPILDRFDPKVSISSDVHRLDELGVCRDQLRRMLDL